MSNLSEKEKKQIQKYCVFPKISWVAIIMSFALCGLIVVLEMIDDMVFHNKGFQPGGMYARISADKISNRIQKLADGYVEEKEG